MERKIVLICLLSVLSMFFPYSAFACMTCSTNNFIDYQKGLRDEDKAVKVYGSLFLSEEQLLSADFNTSQVPPQSSEDSVNLLPMLCYILNDKLIIKAVYSKFIFPASPEGIRSPKPEPSDSLSLGLSFSF